ncbi:PREDICTED: FYVE, RhoGEF and PH domain-containing protein 6-like [Priapulus caudatus]|uniref:FYVE, RhoGEF and PH domain-containing protein 6-like n=1 Tax=Priapulus caudatus TaxID=37621 RepID=A0ABM1ESH0_PRICU|nr:PREDICTED: FYVE, RhoGEF and PH domain-containing protein 6-like [Priapulus caudatus]
MTLAGEQVAAGNDWPEENPRSLEFLTGRSHEAEDILDGAGDGDGDREKVLKMKKANSCSGMMGWKSIFSIWGKGAGEKPEDGEQEAAELPRDAFKSAKTLPSRRPPAPPPPNEHQAPDDHFYWYIEHGQMPSDSSSTSGDAGGSGPSPNHDQYYSSINDSSADTGKADSCKSDSGIDVSALCPTTDKSKDSNFIRNLFCLAPATTYATTVGAIPPPLPPARSKKGAVDGIMHDVLDKSKSLPISRVTKDDIEICRDLGPGTASLPPHIHLPSLKNEDMIYMDCDEAAFAERPSDSSSEESADELDDEQANRQKEKRTFYIAQEMATSERTFVDVLRLLNEDFRGAVLAAGREKGKPVVPEETLSQVLMHLPQLQNLNSGLADDLAARIATWDKRPQIADVFVKFGPFLKLHASYIKDFAQMTQGLDDACKKYPAFAKAVKEFEMSSLCCNLALKHYMLKPVQRIPQYRLLLQDYLKYLPDRSPDKKDTRLALQIVTDVASHANETIKKEEKFEKLFQLQERLLGGRIIVKPGRVLLKQGEVLNISRKEPQMRNLFLLNDVLLYAVPLPNTMYRLSAILPLSGMKVVKPALEAYENEFHIITVERSFTFATRTPSEREEWIVAIAPAVIENAEKRSTFKTSRTTMAKRSIYEKDGSVKLGTKAPIWIPETRVTMCMMCTCDFGVRSRRHHCRACGKVVCSTCASNKAPLLYRKYQSARVCGSCYDKLWTDYARMRDEDVRSSVYEMKDDIYGTVGECYGLGHDDLRTRFKKADTKKKVRHMPQRLKEVCANDAGSAISGYLHKRVKKGKWQRLWFVVKDKVLYSYKASEDVAALDATPLLGFNVQTMDTIEVFEGVDASLVFELCHHRKSMFIFHTDAASARERWVTLITEQTVLV